MAHALDDVELGIGDCLRGLDSSGKRHQRIGIAVDNQRWDRHRAQRFLTTSGDHDCRELTREPRRVDTSRKCTKCHLACTRLFERKARATQAA